MPTGRIGALLLTACLISACTTLREQSGGVPLLKGWAQASGEIRIYAERRNLGHLYDQTCVSGVMTESRMLPDAMRNRYVAVYGRWMSVAALEEMIVRGVSIGAENYCAGDRLFIAERIVVLD